MTGAPTTGRASPLLAALAGFMVLVDGALVAIGVLVWGAHRNGNLAAAEAATFSLLGASAAVGTVIMLLAAIAFARGPRGRGPAGFASGLAWLRLTGVLAAIMVIAIRLGGSAIVGAFETFGAVLAVAEATGALIVTGAAIRWTGRG